MSLQTLTFIVVGATFALYIGIAIWSRATATGELYVAGRGIHPVANGMATAADWMSAASFISIVHHRLHLRVQGLAVHPRHRDAAQQ